QVIRASAAMKLKVRVLALCDIVNALELGQQRAASCLQPMDWRIIHATPDLLPITQKPNPLNLPQIRPVPHSLPCLDVIATDAAPLPLPPVCSHIRFTARTHCMAIRSVKNSLALRQKLPGTPVPSLGFAPEDWVRPLKRTGPND